MEKFKIILCPSRLVNNMNIQLLESNICNYEKLVRIVHSEKTNSICEYISALRIILDVTKKLTWRKVAPSTISIIHVIIH